MRRAAAAILAAALAGCGGSSKSTTTSAASTARPTNITPAPKVKLVGGFRLTSPAFKSGGSIPKQYTCDGAGTPIPLSWSGVPKHANELVLAMRDPDVPSGPFLHWAVAGISPSATSPSGVEGANSAGGKGYAPPCPPTGKAHHYVITLSALTGRSNLKPGFAPDQLRTAAVGIATLIGTYARR